MKLTNAEIAIIVAKGGSLCLLLPEADLRIIVMEIRAQRPPRKATTNRKYPRTQDTRC